MENNFKREYFYNRLHMFYEFLLLAIGIIIFAFCVGWLVNHALNRSALIECHTLQEEAVSLNGFYITPDQASECAYYHISINAPVK